MNYWYTLDIRHLDRPTNWNEFFGLQAPLMLEIGFGQAGHLIHLGKTNPDKNVIGIETSRPSLKKASSKVKNNRTENVRVVDGSGSALLWQNIEPQTLDEVHINFPDPWYKEGHQKRQLINDDFMVLLASRMKEDSLLFIATDHADYQPVVTECLEKSPHFDSRIDTTYTLVDNERFRTKYELKALKEGRVPFYYFWKRNSTPVTQNFDIPEEMVMPHAILETNNPLRSIVDAFETVSFKTADESVVVRFIEIFESTNDSSLLVETFINQKPQPQRLGLMVRQHNDSEWSIQMHELGFPRSNESVHFAVGQLAKWILENVPNVKLVRHNLATPIE